MNSPEEEEEIAAETPSPPPPGPPQPPTSFPSSLLSPTNPEMDFENPPSLILDVPFNISPSPGDGPPPLDEDDFGEFTSQEVDGRVEETIKDSFSPLVEDENVLIVDQDTASETPERDQSPNIPDDREKDEKSAENSLEDDFGDFVENEGGVVVESNQSEQLAASETKDENCDFNKELVAESIPKVVKEEEDSASQVEESRQVAAIPESKNSEDDDEFDEFTDFTAVPAGQSTAAIESSRFVGEVETEAKSIEFEADFNQFANFDNFPSAEEVVEQKSSGSLVAVRVGREETKLDEDDFDDEDDFGDFASSAPVAAVAEAPAPVVVEEKMPEIDISNVDGILKEMFPERTIQEEQGSSMARTIKHLVNIGEYETTALTNEYQWTKSVSNKCLVKCLGIDTRNIVSRNRCDLGRWTGGCG